MDARIFLELGERTTTERPIDDAGSLADLDAIGGMDMPTVVDGVTGRARLFAGDEGLGAVDVVPGRTLLTRDVTVQAILAWDLAAQVGLGGVGTIIARGLGGSAAEYAAFILQLRVVHEVSLAGELRWGWQDLAGTRKMQIGGHFQASSDVVMVTATRRWVSSTEVVLRYYLGDELLSEVTSGDGAIGGGTTGTTTIGYWDLDGQPLTGVLEQLRVLPRELCHEEIRATWDRMTVHQPRSRQLVRELHPPGFPMSISPASRIQRENALWGDTLGYGVAQGENLRKNAYPHRAYGPILDEWEVATRQAPGPRDSTELRRNRVTGRLAQRRGVSIPGIGDALTWFVDTDVDNLDVLAFDQTIREDWAAIAAERWWAEPSADFTISAAALRVQSGAANLRVEDQTWKTIRASIGGNGRAARILSKLTFTTFPANAEAGVFLGDMVNGNYILLGVRFSGGNHLVVHERFQAHVSQGAATTITNLGAGVPAAVWLHLYHDGTIGFGDVATPSNFKADYSITSQIAGYVSSGNLSHPSKSQWSGHYLRGNVAGAVDVKFDDTIIRAACGDRTYFVYVYRDPALPGRPDLVGGNAALDEIAHAWTHAHLITKKSVLCDDPACLCDGGPLGGI